MNSILVPPLARPLKDLNLSVGPVGGTSGPCPQPAERTDAPKRKFLLLVFSVLSALSLATGQIHIPDPYTDLDRTGLWDSWEIQYFSTTGIDARQDHDGQNAQMEMLAGSDPLDARSCFQQAITNVGQPPQITFSPLINEPTYTVMKSVTLSDWAELDSGNLDKLGNLGTVTDTHTTPGVAFYRIPIQNSQSSPEDHLIAHYPFNGNANDESGNDLHAMVTGATLAEDRNGKDASAYYFDGSSYLTVEAEDSFLNVNTAGWTLSLWVKPDADQNNNSVPLVSYGYGRNGGYSIDYWHQYRMIRSNFYDYSWSGMHIAQDNLDDDIWYMYSITYDGETLKQYINGVLVSQTTGGYYPTTPKGTYNLRIGANSISATFFKGYLDDVRIYSRALTDMEIAWMSGISGAVRATDQNAYSLADFELGILRPAKFSNYWAVWGNDGNAYIEVVENPLKSATNSSRYVAVAHTFPSLPLPDTSDCDKSEYVFTTTDGLATDQHHIMKWKLLFMDDNILNVDIVWNWMSFNQIHTGAAKYPNGPGTTETDDTIAEGGGIFNDLVKDGDGGPASYRFRYRAIPDDRNVVFDIDIGEWMSFTYEIFWTKSSNGFWRVWKNGELLAYANNVKTLPDSYDPATDDFLHFKTGLYNKWSHPLIDHVSMYMDDIELYVGEEIRVEDVAPECDITTLPDDTEAPTAPGQAKTEVLNHSAVRLTWSAATDNVGVTHYKVYRNGTEVAVVTATTYDDSGLSAETKYTYTVTALDAAENESEESQSVSATTPQAPAPGELTINRMFQNNMVLQRDKPVAVWGKSDPGASVTVSIASVSNSAITDNNGNWFLYLDPVSADGEPHTLTIQGNNSTLVLSNILYGDVYLGSGQSNMDRTIATEAVDVHGTLINANLPRIRLLNLSGNRADTPQKEISRGTWTLCNSETASGFSALLYFFGKDLYEQTNVPIGLIRCAVGGTYIDSWHPNLQADLYNGMVAPLMPFTMNGVLWYQGESDAGSIERSSLWGQRYKELIELWREGFKQPKLPFFCTQLASYRWLYLYNVREGQYQSMRLSNSGCTTAIDIGDTNDIHPKTKEVLGPRFALWARKFLYGQDLPFTGPLWETATRVGNTIELTFEYVGSGLELRGGGSNSFEIAGADEDFKTATVEIIHSNSIRVFNASVAEPAWVRYAWAADPPVTLYGGDDLPAPAFLAEAGATGPMPSFNSELVNTRVVPPMEDPEPYPAGEVVLHFKFNENSGSNAEDSSNYNNDGTISGATWTTGHNGSALLFSSAGDRVECPVGLSLQPERFTAAAWVKLDSTGSMMNILSCLNSGGWSFLIDRSSTRPVMAFAWWSSGRVTNYFRAITPLTTGIWYHVAITVDNGGTIRFYLNGNLDGSGHMSTSFSYADTSLIIGASASGWYGGHFNGSIDDVFLYNSVMSADQLTELTGGSSEVNHAPVLSPIINRSIQAGQQLQITVQASDGDGDGLQYSATGR